jgi:hypothetical protein
MLTDHDLQNELTAAFRERAGPATQAVVNPAGIFRRAVRDRQHRRMAAGAASVMAVVAVAAGVSVASRTARPALSPVDQPPGLLLEAAVTGPPPARAAVSGMPPYYVTTDHDRPVAEVRDSASGKILSAVRLPQGIEPKMSKITAAGDDRTFVLALSFPQTRFYLLRVTADGRSARLTPLSIPPLPAGESANDIAVSPDGSKLAVAVQFSGGQQGAVEAVSLATGAVHTWTTARTGMPWALSWADGGRELGFFWDDGGPSAGSPQTTASGLWVLDATAPGSDLMSGRRIIPEFTGGDDVQSAVLTPDGAAVIASVTYDGTGHVGRGTVVGGIAELSAQTGHPLRTLLAEHAPYSAAPEGHAGWYIATCTLAAADATGNHLLVNCDSFGRLDHGRFTALPGSAPQTATAAAW